MNGDAPLVVELAAPTGKAAARLEEALRAGRAAVPPALRHAIPERASTLHRLLAPAAGLDAGRRRRERPLRADVVVVDEASMVDLALMAKLVRAVRPEARLLLLGDKDQLASVEAGAVLGDLCGDAPGFSPSFAATVGVVTGQTVPAGGAGSAGPLRDTVVVLRESRRFTADSGIARLAAAVNRGDGDEACALLAAGAADLLWQPMTDARAERERLAGAAADGFGPYLERVRRARRRRRRCGPSTASASCARTARARRAWPASTSS